MKQTIYSLTVALIFGALTPSVSQAQSSALDYWPMKVGSTWKISMKAGGQTLVQDITVTDNKNGVASLDYQMNGRTVQTEKYKISSKSISRLAAGAGGTSTLSPPVPIIQFPMKPGMRWKWKGTINVNGEISQASAVLSASKPVSLKTAAGTFNATKVHMTLTVAQKGSTMTIPNDYWFAPKVGLVKQEMTIMGNKVGGELVSYKMKK